MEYATIVSTEHQIPAGAPVIVGGEHLVTDSISGVDWEFYHPHKPSSPPKPLSSGT